ncbi:MAG: OmpH family outer membrane protein [Bacteroidia bacterium]
MQSTKTAFVNIQEVFSKFELKKDYEKKLNFSKTSRQKIVDSLEMELKILGRKIEGENAKNKEDLNVFSVKRQTYMEKRKLLEEDDLKQTKQYDNEIILQMNQYIKDYGKENNYTYIFGSDGNGSLMYAKDSKDVTKEVVEYINAHYSGIK